MKGQDQLDQPGLLEVFLRAYEKGNYTSELEAREIVYLLVNDLKPVRFFTTRQTENPSITS
ncbi:hypothetical protein AM501_13130 [Aneurinibacillus migulanus]|uniref:Uncharacterized protein n=1 Tax=Aneurinibacillus migulanus TaxID=47500 RepID=A0A0D1Y4F7_ANEMI|nr:hypothetical protein [Aneurinibacillus migulanus]KIV54132.1 hypothetical protein TS65_19595 [Aneurinibacillus migulanus]KON97596.1 hypothetical protein AF333_21210 [Aneurinibacillus migulanus]KPD07877.1 hypothetical protein AM501_13130 [Aneurinibacillus migulanus]MED0896613.1 hypothetical protein [Aneurinibacillus migulanus]MED1615992.1 hypothetical protein [Aneurinibacillus migulanus]